MSNRIQTHRVTRYPLLWLGTGFAIAFVVLLLSGQILLAVGCLLLSFLGAIRRDHCRQCGNPVVRTARTCPTCQADLRLLRRKK